MLRNKTLRFFIISFLSALFALMLTAGLYIADRNSAKIGFEARAGIIEAMASQNERLDVSIMGERFSFDLTAYNAAKEFILAHETYWPKKLRFCRYAAEYFVDIVNSRP